MSALCAAELCWHKLVHQLMSISASMTHFSFALVVLVRDPPFAMWDLRSARDAPDEVKAKFAPLLVFSLSFLRGATRLSYI